jgi:hypothetical protein
LNPIGANAGDINGDVVGSADAGGSSTFAEAGKEGDNEDERSNEVAEKVEYNKGEGGK